MRIITIKSIKRFKARYVKRTARVSKQARFGEGVCFGLLEVGRESMNLNGPARRYEGLLQHFLLVTILAKPLLTLPTLQDDVDVASDQCRDLFSCR